MLKKRFGQLLDFLFGPHAKWMLRLRSWANRSAFPSIQHIMDTSIRSQDDVFFVQVGAYTGQIRDPLYKYIILEGWNGLLIEPQTAPFQTLKRNFKNNEHLIFENIAISDRNGKKAFYYIEPSPELPVWVSQLSSFHREIPEQIKETYPKAELKSKQIDCMTLTSLFDKHGIGQVDILVIDTEGHDFIILKSMDFGRYKPKLVLFEHCHLDKTDYESAIHMLEQHGYALFASGFNTLAFTDPSLKHLYDKHLVRS